MRSARCGRRRPSPPASGSATGRGSSSSRTAGCRRRAAAGGPTPAPRSRTSRSGRGRRRRWSSPAHRLDLGVDARDLGVPVEADLGRRIPAHRVPRSPDRQDHDPLRPLAVVEHEVGLPLPVGVELLLQLDRSGGMGPEMRAPAGHSRIVAAARKADKERGLSHGEREAARPAQRGHAVGEVAAVVVGRGGHGAALGAVRDRRPRPRRTGTSLPSPERDPELDPDRTRVAERSQPGERVRADQPFDPAVAPVVRACRRSPARRCCPAARPRAPSASPWSSRTRGRTRRRPPSRLGE